MTKLPPSPLKTTTPLHLHLFFFVLLFFLPFPGNTQTPNTDQTILLKIKQEWSNPPSLISWDPSNTTHHCNWTGVLCDDTGSVNGLSFRNFNITDKLPSSICDINNLTLLDLSLNYIPGEFPIFLYKCSNLQTLNLSQNFFIGPIPPEIDRISTLTFLSLAANNFSANIPPTIGNLPELRVLDLNNNLFNGTFPVEIGNLSNLQELRMAYNPFLPSKIHPEFGRLKKLRFLWMVGANLIGEIPETFSNLTDLEYLDLKTNNLSGKIPSGLFLLKNLTHLFLTENKLSGEIPRRIESLLKLVEIDLSVNDLTGPIPEEFGKLELLSYMIMYNNSLTGEIPASIGRLPSLIEIRLFNNKLSGILPPELGRHSKLETLEVSQNQLTGNLPESLCAGGAFVGVTAFSNNLSGGLPRSLENCASLMYVQLYNNRFSGQVPDSFWRLRNLSTVMISDNLFSGELPDGLSRELSRLEMSNNRFTGRIPLGIVYLTNLRVFEASNNLLSGEIPLELTALPQLSRLLLDGNRLSGEIPAQVTLWESLVTLNLSRNQLSGEIPSSLGSLPQVSELDLSQNQLFGGVPFEIGQLKLTYLDLSSNKLTGRIPIEFDNQVYSGSFLNNSGLCADDRVLNLKPCNSELKHTRKLSTQLLVIIIVLFTAILLFVALLFFFMTKGRQRREQEDDLSTWKMTSFQRLDFTETNIFPKLTENNLIGSGSSGEVYRVPFSGSSKCVAVKKIWSAADIDQNLERAFLTEVQILGTIRHSNIVKLLCCISNKKSKLLVYEHMENSSLDTWLHRKKQGSLVSRPMNRSALDWPMRMEIAVGAAQGLCYMHHNCTPPIIHRDVKSSNILLDSEFNAKIADFGLARMLHRPGEPNAMSVFAGSFGYIAPECAQTNKLNEKIDVYSFGVVLLELVTGREANDGDEHTCLAEKVWSHFQDGNPIEDILDREVKKPCFSEEMCMVLKLGIMCTATLPSTRPSMKEALQILLWRGPMSTSGERKAQNENDVAPLLDDTTESSGIYKNKQRKRSSDNSLASNGDRD